jgi:hypothetical protein
MTVDQVKQKAVEYADLCTDKEQLKEFMIELISKVYQQGLNDARTPRNLHDKKED